MRVVVKDFRNDGNYWILGYKFSDLKEAHSTMANMIRMYDFAALDLLMKNADTVAEEAFISATMYASDGANDYLFIPSRNDFNDTLKKILGRYQRDGYNFNFD